MFKSVTIFQLTQPTNAVIERLESALKLPKAKFKPCGKHDRKTHGFVKPLGDDSKTMTYEANGGILFCLRTDEKPIPGSTVKELVQQESRKREKGGKEVNKTDIHLIKEAIVDDMLPGATAARSRTYAYLDKELAMLLVGATGDVADEFKKALSGILKSTPLELLGTSIDPCDKFTAWIKDFSLLGAAFNLGEDCDMKHPKEGGCGIINVKKEDVEADDICALLDAGRECCRIALEHEDMTFALKANLCIHKIALSDDQLAEIGSAEDEGAQLANIFAGFVPVMRTVLRALEPLLGGWPKQEMLDLEGEQEDAA